MAEVVSIALGFVLTTIVGGWWASRLQHRSWEHQQAAEVCRDVTGLLDKRLYRMMQVFWAIGTYEGGKGDERLAARMEDYRTVLYEWNDRLNVNLAVVGSHFGMEARDHLDLLYDDFQRVGAQLEDAARDVREGKEVFPALEIVGQEFEGHRAGSLNSRTYWFGLAMTTRLRENRIGRRAPEKAVVRSLMEPAGPARGGRVAGRPGRGQPLP